MTTGLFPPNGLAAFTHRRSRADIHTVLKEKWRQVERDRGANTHVRERKQPPHEVEVEVEGGDGVSRYRTYCTVEGEATGSFGGLLRLDIRLH